AEQRIRPAVRETPLLPLPGWERVYIKAENLQHTGSFKLRGAFNAISLLSESERTAGVVTHSSGNHGQAVACAASLLGAKATVVIPEGAPEVKLKRTASWGAKIVRCGPSAKEREETAAAVAQSDGATIIPPFD